jgi:hypothetical protein
LLLFEFLDSLELSEGQNVGISALTNKRFPHSSRMGFTLLGREVVSGITSLCTRDSLSRPDTTSLCQTSTFFSSPYPKEESSILERTLRAFSPNLKKLVHGRHSSFYAYMNTDLATQVVIGYNFFLSSAWTGDDGPPRKYLVRHHPPVLYQEGWSFVQNWTFLITPLSSTKRGGLLSEIGLSSSPPCPLPGGAVHCLRSDISPHPLSSTKSGGLLSEIRLSSSPLCPLPGGAVHCPRSDISPHPPVLYQEGWSFVRDWTFLLVF